MADLTDNTEGRRHLFKLMAAREQALVKDLNGQEQLPQLPPRLVRIGSEARETATILIVDGEDISRRVLTAMLRNGPYRILSANRASDALEILEHKNIDVIVIDLVMPGMSGSEFCSRIKANRKTQLIPILMLTGVGGSHHEIEGIAAGADEFLTKPLHPEVVRTRIRAMLRNKSAIDSLDEAETILFALAQAVEARDSYTGGHCRRLADYSVSLGQALGLPEDQLVALHRGGYLHDIGKVSIPDAILFKNGPLDADEWRVMKSHTIIGEEICQPMKTLAPVLSIIRSHHERWDGSGYPDGLRGEDIPMLARVLQVVDIYDALTTSRPYKPAYSLEEAFQILVEEADRGWRDIELVALFREVCSNFHDTPRKPITVGPVEISPLTQSLEAMRRHVSR